MSARRSGAASAAGSQVAAPADSRASDGAAPARQPYLRSDHRRESGSHSLRAMSSTGQRRPSACRVLTPQFHWNLNAHAVESLSDDEIAQVYQLFRFYDSSTVGDALPSINCRRFLQVLHDARLIAPLASDSQSRTLAGLCYERVEEEGGSSATDDVERLHVADVEKLFAEAVMGKLRTHLDADAQPVLTFHLFCGALLHCATSVFPALRAQPAVAFRTLLDRLLTAADRYADDRLRETQRHSHSGDSSARRCEAQPRSRQRPSLGQQVQPPQPQASASAGERQRLGEIDPQARCSLDQGERPRSSVALLQHFPSDGTDALWYPHEANGAKVTQTLSHMSSESIASESACADRTATPTGMSSSNTPSLSPIDFRSLKPYQQVLATFSLDVVRDAHARERSQQQYAIPPALAAHFSPEHLRLVVERFRLFDVFDRGALPRQEILPLLTALVKRLEIPDMYDVLTLLLTGERAARGDKSIAAATVSSDSAPSSSLRGAAEISLHQVLHAIYTCRRSRTSSTYGSGSSSAGIEPHETSVRKAGASKATSSTSSSSAATGGLESGAVVGPAPESADERDLCRSDVNSGSPSRKGTASSKKPALKTKGTANKATAVASRRSVASDPAAQQQHKHSVVLKDTGALDSLKALEPSTAGTAAASLPRRASRRKSKQVIGSDSAGAASDDVVGTSPETLCMASHAPSDRSSLTQNDLASKSHAKAPRGSTTAAEASLETGDKLVVQMPASGLGLPESAPSAALEHTAPGSNGRTNQRVTRVRVHMLLGGEHDGAIYYSIELALPERRLDESRGVYFLNAPYKELERTQVLPVQPDSESALLMLTKCVQLRQREGFALHPPDQLDVIERMLARIHQRNPHYRSALDSGPSVAARRPSSRHSSSDTGATRMASAKCSLDRSPTRVRQRSASDLRVALSDTRLNESLKATKRAAALADSSSGAAHSRDQREMERAVSRGMAPQALDMTKAPRPADLSWIHAVNDAAHWRQPSCAQPETLQPSASAPLLPVARAKKMSHRLSATHVLTGARELRTSSYE